MQVNGYADNPPTMNRREFIKLSAALAGGTAAPALLTGCGGAPRPPGSGEVNVWLQGAEWEDPDFGHLRSLQLTP